MRFLGLIALGLLATCNGDEGESAELTWTPR